MTTDARFNVKINVNITNADGTSFFNSDTAYDNLPYDKMYEIENKLVGVMNELHALGKPGDGAKKAK